MSVPARTAPAPPTPAAPARSPELPQPAPARRWAWLLLLAGCVALAALTLLGPSEPTYDPRSWILWGRELARGTLDTVGGPSWKPLPVAFTAPFSLAGDAAAPQLWLVVARAGGLLGIVMGFRLAARLGGLPAAVIAAVAILVADGYWDNAWRGNSEGLLTALTLWAVERHLDGRRTSAFVLGFAAGLLRPELWPLWGAYGVWLAYREPGRRAVVAACFAAIPLAWFLPEYLGSGDLFRAAARAREPDLGSPAYADFPAYEVLRSSLRTVPIVVGAGAAAAVAAALRRRSGEGDRVVLSLAAGAVALMAIVALMTQAGFSGNLRYVVLPIALLCVLSGAGWVALVRAARRRAGILAAAAVVAAGLAAAGQAAPGTVGELHRRWDAMRTEATNIGDLSNLVAGAGGRDAFSRCGRVFTTRFEVPLVAWTLHLRFEDVEISPRGAGTVTAMKGSALAADPRFERFAASARWVAARRC